MVIPKMLSQSISQILVLPAWLWIKVQTNAEKETAVRIQVIGGNLEEDRETVLLTRTAVTECVLGSENGHR